LAIAFLLEAQDTTVKSDKDVELLLKLPTLAVIPAIKMVIINDNNGSAKRTSEQKDAPINMNVGV
jgi:hypothetical protein